MSHNVRSGDENTKYVLARQRDGIIQYAHCAEDMKGNIALLKWESPTDAMADPYKFRSSSVAWRIWCMWRDQNPYTSKGWWVSTEEVSI